MAIINDINLLEIIFIFTTLVKISTQDLVHWAREFSLYTTRLRFLIQRAPVQQWCRVQSTHLIFNIFVLSFTRSATAGAVSNWKYNLSTI